MVKWPESAFAVYYSAQTQTGVELTSLTSLTSPRGALMTAARLSWHHSRVHNNPFTSDVTSADDRATPRLLPTDAEAQVSRSAVVSGRTLRRRHGSKCRRLLSDRDGGIRMPARLAGVVYFSRQRWRPNQLWQEFLWLTSAACGVRAAISSDDDWRHAVTASRALAVPSVAAGWRCRTAVIYLELQNLNKFSEGRLPSCVKTFNLLSVVNCDMLFPQNSLFYSLKNV